VAGRLTPLHCLPLVEQHMLPGHGVELLLTAKGRQERFARGEDLFHTLGVESALTPFAMPCSEHVH
jgi:hypothetical protein